MNIFFIVCIIFVWNSVSYSCVQCCFSYILIIHMRMWLLFRAKFGLSFPFLKVWNDVSLKSFVFIHWHAKFCLNSIGFIFSVHFTPFCQHSEYKNYWCLFKLCVFIHCLAKFHFYILFSVHFSLNFSFFFFFSKSTQNNNIFNETVLIGFSVYLSIFDYLIGWLKENSLWIKFNVK